MEDLHGFDLGSCLVNRQPPKDRVVVYHEDRESAVLITTLLSKLGYKCVQPANLAKLRTALKIACHAAVIDAQTCSKENIKLRELLEAVRIPLLLIITSDDGIDTCDLANAFGGPATAVHSFHLADLSGGRLAECLTVPTPASPTPQAVAPISPKLRVVQSMLHEIVKEGTPDATMIFSRTLPSRAGDNRDRVGADARIAKLPAMILQGQTLAALATCHEIEEEFSGQSVTDQVSSVSDLRRCLEQELLETDIELVTNDLRLRPISNRSVLIGRPSKERAVDVAINCRWFSRGDKSLRLSSEGTEWFVEDLGSANGSFIGEKRLQRNSRHTLPVGQTTIEIGRSFDRRSPVILHLNRVVPDVVIVSVSVGAAFDKAGWQTWPTLQEDLVKRWLIFRDEFVLGSDYTNKALGLDTQDKAAAITFRNGFWINPVAGSEIRIGGTSFRSAIPLSPGNDLTVGALKLRVERAHGNVAQTESSPDQIRISSGTRQ